MKEKPPIIESIRVAQTISTHNGLRIAPDEGLKERFEHFKAETAELAEALDLGDRKKIGSELADLMIIALSIASLAGVDMEQAVSYKLNRNFFKYSARVEALVKEGLDYRSAREQAKAEWDKSKDYEFDID